VPLDASRSRPRRRRRLLAGDRCCRRSRVARLAAPRSSSRVVHRWSSRRRSKQGTPRHREADSRPRASAPSSIGSCRDHGTAPPWLEDRARLPPGVSHRPSHLSRSARLRENSAWSKARLAECSAGLAGRRSNRPWTSSNIARRGGLTTGFFVPAMPERSMFTRLAEVNGDAACDRPLTFSSHE